MAIAALFRRPWVEPPPQLLPALARAYGAAAAAAPGGRAGGRGGGGPAGLGPASKGNKLGIPGVEHIIAVASGKGGVGKSTTAGACSPMAACSKHRQHCQPDRRHRSSRRSFSISCLPPGSLSSLHPLYYPPALLLLTPTY